MPGQEPDTKSPAQPSPTFNEYGSKQTIEPATPASPESSENEMCFNHPWRQAYARCAFCKRPFCYADLIEYNGQQYCLEDLGHAKVSKKELTLKPNRFTYVASILFLANSFVILHYIFPQIVLVVRQVQTVGVLDFLATITYGYEIVLVSLVLMTFGFISSVTVLSNSGRRFAASAIILFTMLIFFIYEYLTAVSIGAPNYLLYVIFLLFANILMIALSRVTFVSKESERRFFENVEWPRIETF